MLDVIIVSYPAIVVFAVPIAVLMAFFYCVYPVNVVSFVAIAVSCAVI